MSTAVDVAVRDNPARSRFEAVVDDETVGFAAYRLGPDRIVFTHTEVDDSMEGQGVGSRLAAGALDRVRERGLGVVAQCPFIRSYLEEHPEHADLVVES